MANTFNDTTLNLKFLQAEGYLVVPGVVQKRDCQDLVESFKEEVKPYEGDMLRSTSAKMEKHSFSDSGMMTNPILSIEDLTDDIFPQFLNKALEILSSNEIQALLIGALKDNAVLVQSAYYESSVGTYPHADCHYFDSEGHNLVGCWIALEDIPDEAGRFYVYPQTHSITDNHGISDELIEVNRQLTQISSNAVRVYHKEAGQFAPSDFMAHHRLVKKLTSLLKTEKLTPELKQGDVVLFSSRLLHGCEMPKEATRRSRSSLIGHFMPASERLMRFGSQREELKTRYQNGLEIQPNPTKIN